jgi:CO dehydrogenase/acetyl-CoA synthase alpha subunit
MIHDITHCANADCQDKAHCLRWQAYQDLFQNKSNKYIEYASVFNPETKSKCEYFINTKEDESMDSKR